MRHNICTNLIRGRNIVFFKQLNRSKFDINIEYFGKCGLPSIGHVSADFSHTIRPTEKILATQNSSKINDS